MNPDTGRMEGAGPDAVMRSAAASHQRGDLDAAERGYREVLAVAPKHPDAVHFLGLLLYQRGADDEALPLLDLALRLDPANYQYRHNLAGVMKQLGRTTEAEQLYREALRLKPDHVEAHAQLGLSLCEGGRLELARDSFESALRLAPRHPQALIGRGNVLNELGSRRTAIESYRAAGASACDADQLHAVGLALREAGATDEAVECFRRAIALDSCHVGAHHSLGICLADQGRLSEAEDCYRRVLALSPGHLGAYHNLSAILRLDAQDPLWPPLMELAAHADRLADPETVLLHFTLGKICEDRGEYDQAFEHWLVANRRKRGLIRYDAARQQRFFDEFKRWLDDDWAERNTAAALDTERPVFVIGMSRSGTTLVEQILASHPQVFGAGELRALPQQLRRETGPVESDDRLPARVASLTPEALRRVAQGYDAALAEYAPDATRVTDKLSGNMALVGLIHVLFPRARIVHCRRDPLDTCASCFSKLFTTGHAFSYDLSELGGFYRMYAELMNHWRAHLPPGRMFEIRYEDLVADFENQARRLVEYCGLPWDEACLHFHATERPVKTASQAQVRRPLYAGSVGRWRRYAKYLTPLQAALDESADTQRGGV